MKVSKVLSAFMLMVFFVATSAAQDIDFNNYTPLKSQGDLPLDFTARTSEKVAEAIENQVDKGEARATRVSKAEFLLKANYMIDNLLMSGNVMFGDPTTDYVNRVADKILENEPELRNKLRFYCIKSNVTNAFTTNQGMIFVTLGLLAQLENEAQLAFILGHEVTHFKRKHVINTVLESDKIFSKNNRTTKMSQDQNIIKLSNYSKNLELESDSTGFYYVQKAGYDMDEVLSSFDILQFSYLPYDEIDINFSEFETKDFSVPKELQLDTLIEIDFEVEEDDSKSTHPNLNKRRDEIFDLMEEYSGVNKGVTAIVSKKDFFKVRKISRYETVRIDLKNLNFVKAYYNANVLLAENPESQYLKKSIAKALYGIVKLKLNNRYSYSADDYEEYEGAISAAYYFFENSEEEALAAMTIKYIFELNEENPHRHLDLILKDLTLNFIEEHSDFKFEKYFPKHKEEKKSEEMNEEVTKETETESDKPLSKYEKLKKIKEAQEDVQESGVSLGKDIRNYYRFIFIDYKKREDIKKVYETAQIEVDKKEAKNKELEDIYADLTSRQRYSAEKRDKKAESKKYKTINAIGADKVVFVDPLYYSVDERRGVKLENSEDLKYKFYEQLKYVSAKADLELEILSPKLCEANEFEKMNNLSICNDWIEELNDLSDVSERMSYIPAQSEYMYDVSNAYNTENIGFTGVIDFKNKKHLDATSITLGVLIPYLWPVLAYFVLTPSHEMYYYTFIYNSKTGDTVVDKIYFLKTKPRAGNIQSYMYDMFSTIKSTENEK